MKILRGISITVVGLALSGCFEAGQDFTFKEDGTAIVETRLAIEASMIAMIEIGDGYRFCSDELSAASERGLLASQARSTEGTKIVCTMSIEGPTDTLVAYLDEGGFLPIPDDGKEKIRLKLAEVDGRHELVISIPPVSSDEPEDEVARNVQQMVMASMAGVVLSWSVTAPKIVESTGTILEDGTRAEFSFRFADAFADKDTATEFRTVFTTKKPGFLERLFR
jgi:hypothetical protein